jgi:hypothetical protein
MEIVEGLLVKLEKSKSKGKRKSIANVPTTPALTIATENSIAPSEPPGSSHGSLFTPHSPPSESPNTAQSGNSAGLSDRVLGDGHQVYNAYWYSFRISDADDSVQCAIDQGFHASQAQPATHTHFNHHPKASCQIFHLNMIQYTIGCSVHWGVRDATGNCDHCVWERVNGQFIYELSLKQKIGYSE